ncbi:MAG: hypothetical protein HYV19_04330 [Gemmatimonadetes bacterium]|nr:hypothetical protein [Gemmatimonadota bacterium]
MRVWRAAIAFSLTACGGQIQGTAAAPAGTAVLIYRTDAADEYVRSVEEHDRPLFAAIDLSQRAADSGQRAIRIVDSVRSAPRRDGTGEFRALGRGTVGVGGVLAINGRYRGRLALVLEPSAQLPVGCRVDVTMPLRGDRLVTLAGQACGVWPEPIEPDQLRRDLAAKWQQDSIALAAGARADSTARARNAAMLKWPFVADRDGVYYFKAGSTCAAGIPKQRLTYLRDAAYAHKEGYARSEEPGC